MTLTLDPQLSQSTVACLQRLRALCLRMESEFRSSAGQSQAEDVRALLRRRAEDSRSAAAELQAHVHRLDRLAPAQPEDEATSPPPWQAAHSTLASHTDPALLEACERQEDAAIEAYTDVLTRQLEPASREVLERQRMDMRRQHELLRAMRDRLRGLSE